MSIIDACFEINKHCDRFNCCAEDGIRQLRNGSVAEASFDYSGAQLLRSKLTKFSFPALPRSEALRQVLFDMAVELKPFWAKMAPTGRQRVLRIVGDDQLQCFRYAGLLSTEEPALEWWDNLASHFRAKEAEDLLAIGREGEKLTLKYERSVLLKIGIARQPQWVAIEDNFAGFDVLSYRLSATNDVTELHVEVKASRADPARFYISRQEWEYAITKQHCYVLHFWNLLRGELRVLTFKQLEQHVPKDSGSGKWQKLLLLEQPSWESEKFASVRTAAQS